jgi:hypothetical protein
MMPGSVAANFADNLLFLLSALELTGVVYVAHFGTLLGSVRLGGVSPWDEDADIYVIGEDRASLERKLRRVLTEHGFLLIWDERGFYWVRQDPWWAGQGHIGLELLPDVAPPGSRRPDHPEDPAIAHEELFPLRRHPFYGTWVWGPADAEAILWRIYGQTGTVATMARFRAPDVGPELEAFWRDARGDGRACGEQRLDWDAISARFRRRAAERRFEHVVTFPWWWANGAYNIGIKRLRRLGTDLAQRGGRGT